MSKRLFVAIDETTGLINNLAAKSSPPTSPASGNVYFDDGTNTTHGQPGLRRYSGTAWVDVGSLSVLTPQSSEPSSPVTGQVYLDDGTNTASGAVGLRYYTGTAWADIGGDDWSDADGNADVDTGTEVCDSYATLVTCSVAWLVNIVNAADTAMRTMWVIASLLVGDDGYGTPTYTVAYTAFGAPDIGTVDTTVFSVTYNSTTHALELKATVGSTDWSVSAKRMEVVA